jgi:hypothetical protein
MTNLPSETLRNATDEELAAELARRQVGEPLLPTKREPIDWSPVLATVEAYLKWCASDEYHEDNDWETHIYEAAVTAVYGDSFWAWTRKVHP